MFLSDTDLYLPYQDFQLKTPWKTLVYTQALQYLAEKVNSPVPGEPPHLLMSIHELRQHMRRYTTFSDHDVFEGLAHRLPEAEVEETTQPNPIKPSVADSPTVLAIVLSTGEHVSCSNCHPCQGGVGCQCTISTALADEPADPPTPSKTMAT